MIHPDRDIPCIDVLHGVNFDVLELREPEQYGSLSLAQLETQIEEFAATAGFSVRCFQSNHEGAFVERLHAIARLEHERSPVPGGAGRAAGGSDQPAEAAGEPAPVGLIVNPGAWTHYSWAIHDALAVVRAPAIEVHLSAVATREPWRKLSVIGGICLATIEGKGAAGYREAIEMLSEHSRRRAGEPA